MKRLLVIAATVWLAGCTTLGDLSGVVPIAEALKDDTNPAGLTSADAAYLGAYRSYASSAKTTKDSRKPILEIEAADGVKEIKLEGIKTLRVYGPEPDVKLVAPQKPKGFADRALDFAERAADLTFRYFLPIDLKRLDNEIESERIKADSDTRRRELGVVSDAIDSMSTTSQEVLKKVPDPTP